MSSFMTRHTRDATFEGEIVSKSLRVNLRTERITLDDTKQWGSKNETEKDFQHDTVAQWDPTGEWKSLSQEELLPAMTRSKLAAAHPLAALHGEDEAALHLNAIESFVLYGDDGNLGDFAAVSTSKRSSAKKNMSKLKEAAGKGAWKAGKVGRAIQLVQGSLEKEEGSASIYAEFVTVLKFVSKGLEELKIPYVEYHGLCTSKQRDKAVKDFTRKGGPKVMLLSKAGGVGLTLTAANFMVIMPGWNPGMDEQAQDRTARRYYNWDDTSAAPRESPQQEGE